MVMTKPETVGVVDPGRKDPFVTRSRSREQARLVRAGAPALLVVTNLAYSTV
jgi:hypothetical protein